MSRARVLLPPYAGERIPVEQALVQPLAEAYGSQVDGISSEEALYDVFEAQGKFLLDAIEQPDDDDPYALRQLSVPHTREKPFTDNLLAGEPLSLRVLYPYAPPYGYLQQTEQAVGKPMRMTFGLARPSETEADHYLVGRTTLWVTNDRMSLNGTFRVLKDTTSREEPVTADGREAYFNSNARSRSRSGFLIRQLLND